MGFNILASHTFNLIPSESQLNVLHINILHTIPNISIFGIQAVRLSMFSMLLAFAWTHIPPDIVIQTLGMPNFLNGFFAIKYMLIFWSS